MKLTLKREGGFRLRRLLIAGLVLAATLAGYPATPHARILQADDAKAGEASALSRRFRTALILTLPVFMVEMGGHFIPAVHHWVVQNIGLQTSWVLQFVLVTLVLVGPGRDFFAKGVPSLFKGAPDMNALVALGTSAAWAFSTIATFAPRLLPEGTRAVYFEAAAVIVTLILLGRLLEVRAKGRTGDAIRKLADEGMTMVIVSHEMAFVREVADKVVFMDAGQIIEAGTPAELFDTPKTDRARNFFSKILRH